jgi:hypothetical protein
LASVGAHTGRACVGSARVAGLGEIAYGKDLRGIGLGTGLGGSTHKKGRGKIGQGDWL